jgi:hypothetical protein
MFRKYFAMAIAGLFVLSVLMLFWRLTAKPKPKVGSPLICAECGQKLAHEGANCSYCKYLNSVRMDRDPGAAAHTSIIRKLGVVSGFLGFLTVVAFWPEISQFHKSRRAAKEKHDVMRCGKCQRKLRYALSSAGKQGLCPCGAVLIFPGGPPGSTSDAAEPVAP